MVRFFKDREIEIKDSAGEYYKKLCNALKTTMSVCIASTSALVINELSAKINKDRMTQYEENSSIAIHGICEIRVFLLRIFKHLEDNKIDFLDGRAAIKNTMSKGMAGNCEHQAFYLAALLRQQNIPALIYDIEDINHTVVIAENYLLDPWIGEIYMLAHTDLRPFYGSSLNMKASWLNRLLSNKKFSYPDELTIQTLKEYFVQLEDQNKIGLNILDNKIGIGHQIPCELSY
ncbi:hypothetical protein D7217_13745 [Legionella pneumophila]|uniref:Dot/Icm T4SS effector Lem5 n=1 Tax=Legionella pneumophila TaxID=446 RepID=UPI000482A1E1|nr:Dot/Icm T4SS effector Lem5 [Legionella pneumophila]RYW87336.1 hypothetical protein D7217_13745 [Legionella pneumophila]STX98594.1 Uncharacterised protein [Legionella pneumophila]HAT1776441.1 Dot/Icm T4SS effector Lem5 [Legionella pneumophila]HAT1779554.1 Dot/Icm T4SS effector Lem5 [Legionella pneumophila]HAT2019756.1 Dot/Icm T4SS effector Lem5 [Legionella pneumophila]